MTLQDDASGQEPSSSRTRIRPRGQVRHDLIAAAVQLAREGGPAAVTLREATRLVGVTPNAAYRHFDDRDSLLNEVCVAGMRMLANFMEDELSLVPELEAAEAARARFLAVGRGYLRFARDENGLFGTAFAVPQHLEYSQDAAAAGRNQRTAFQLLSRSIDELHQTAVVPPERRAGAEYFVWSGVHGFAELAHNGPLRQLPSSDRQQLGEALLLYLLRGL